MQSDATEGPKLVAETLGSPTGLTVIVGVLVILVTTRLISGSQSKRVDGSIVPGSPGYWLPFVGHAVEARWDLVSYLEALRRAFPEGIISLKILGSTHAYVTNSNLVKAVRDLPEEVTGKGEAAEKLRCRIFAFKAEDAPIYDQVLQEQGPEFTDLPSGKDLETLTSSLVHRVKDVAADFVSFNSYIADQTDWERLANAELIEKGDGNNYMEVDFFELIWHFIARTALSAVFGTDLLENFPDLPLLLSRFDEDMSTLAAGTPSWAPFPRFQRARLNRSKLLSYFHAFQTAMEKNFNDEEPGNTWQDLDNISKPVQYRHERSSKLGMSTDGRASSDLALAWSVSSATNYVVSWTLLELFRDPVLLNQVREEIAPFVRATQPKNEFSTGVWVPPEFETLDTKGLVKKCPLLKASYLETLRLYTGGSFTRHLKEDVVVKTTSTSGESFALRRGTHVHVLQGLYHLDPATYPEPQEWQPHRHIEEAARSTEDRKGLQSLGDIDSLGELTSMIQKS